MGETTIAISGLVLVGLLLGFLVVQAVLTLVFAWRYATASPPAPPRPGAQVSTPDDESAADARPAEASPAPAGRRLGPGPDDRSPRRAGSPDQPLVAVLLCLRGADASLPDCLRGVLSQDYPSYFLQVVLDDPGDPARRVLDGLGLGRSSRPPVRIEILPEPPTTGSLKCAALVHAITHLPEEVALVAQLDADTIPHPTWLSELVAPLVADESIGVVTGNRWFSAPDYRAGSLVRTLWNAGAIVQMDLYRIPWGGTLAYRRADALAAGLPEAWSRAFCEDTMLASKFRAIGKRVARPPALMMVNRETIGLPSCFHWISRQLLTAHLYHPARWSIVVHAVLSGLLPLATVVWLVVSLAIALTTGDAAVRADALASALVSGIGIGTYVVLGVGLLLSIAWAVRQALRRTRPEEAGTILDRRYVASIAAMPLTGGVYFAAIFRTLTSWRVVWRGLHYRIGGPFDVRLEQFRPYSNVVASGSHPSLAMREDSL